MRPRGVQGGESDLDVAEQDSPYSEEPWGNECTPTLSSSVRVVGWNPSGLPHDNKKEKNGALLQFINETNPDVVCLFETNTAWHLLPHDQRLEQRVGGWFQTSRTFTAWYKEYPQIRSPRQWGGTAIIVRNNAVSHIVDNGQDPKGLGRWCWVRLKGKDGVHTTVLSAYRPVKNTDADFSTYNQQKLYYETVEEDFDKCPREAFIVELEVEIRKFKQAGDEICLCLDLNDDVREAHEFNSSMGRLHLREAITERHGLQGPPTRRGSRYPIDGTYVSANLHPIASGYSPYVEGVGDHRPTWIDFSRTDIFGHDPGPSTKSTGRRLKCEDPRVVSKYLKVYDEYLKRHGLYTRVAKLQKEVVSGQPLTKAQAKEYEFIDRKRVKGMKIAEKKCRKLRVGMVEWSLELEVSITRHRYWTLVLLRTDGHKINARRLLRMAVELGLENPGTMSREDIMTQVFEAQEYYKQTKKDAITLRGKWLVDLAIARAEKGLESASSGIKVMQHREKVRKDNRVINKVMKPSQRRPLVMVQTTSSSGEKTMHVTKASIEAAGLAENETRFRQSNPTPLQQPAAIDWMGRTGMEEAIDEILLTGKVPPEIASIDPFLEDYLAAHKVGNIPLISAELSQAVHQQGWSKAREYTASGRSGIHFGHFMAGSQQAHIAAFETCLSGIPWITGYSPLRWCQGLNVMIEKKPGEFDVTRLRTILLLEADFNQGNKKLGRDMMRNAEKFGLLAPEQYGSRKFYTAINQGINQRLTFDILRQRKQRGAIVSTDAMSCYDRIVHLAAALAMRRAGAPKPAVHCMLNTLQQLRHYIRTAYGDSVTYFDADDSSGIPIGGSGQGNGASPPIWALISTPIFDAIGRRGYGVFLKCAISGDLLHFVGTAFVDDTDLIVTDKSLLYDATNTSIFDLLQSSLHLWEGFIRASGGAIRPDKSHWYLIDFEWEDGQWYYKEEQPDDPTLIVRNHKGIYEPVERVPVDEGRRMVGVRMAADGSNTEEFAYLDQTIGEWTDKVLSSRLPRHLVWASFTTGIMKKLSYPLPATTLTRAQCDTLMDSLLAVALPSIGVNRNFPKVMAYAPLSAQGWAVPNLYVEQGLGHLQRFVETTMRTGDITGHLFRVSVEQLNLELGVNGCPFAHSHKIWRPLATECLATHMWDFAEHYQLQLQTHTADIPLLREGDKMLMEYLVVRHYRDPNKLAQVNRCRLYLKIARLSDLLTCCGRYIRQDAWDGQAQPRMSAGQLEWPRQGRPSDSDWQRWRDMLVELFGLQLPMRNVTAPLGRWKNSWQQWEWYQDETEESVYRVDHDNAQAQKYTWQENEFRIQESHIHYGRLRKVFPLWQVDVECSETGVMISSRQHQPTFWDLDMALDIPEMSLEEFRCNQFRHETAWAFQHCFCELSNQNILQFVHALEHTGVDAVSDGSPKGGTGAAAWIMVFVTNQLSGGFKVPGPAVAQDSYRCELAGMAAILAVVRVAVRIFQLKKAMLYEACDGESALERAFDNNRQASFKDSQRDIIHLIKRNLSGMPQLQLGWMHVKGHQDDDPYAEINIWGRWNILMDTRAKQIRAAPGQPITFPDTNRLWTVKINGEEVLSQTVTRIREHCTATAAHAYWKKKGRLGTAESGDVDWDVLGTAMQEQDTDKRRWITKHATGWCGVNKNMVRWNFETVDACPRCGKQQEDAKHVWQCPAESARQIWEKKEKEIAGWMKRRKTHPEIAKVISSRLRCWRAGTRRAPIRSRLTGLSAIVQVQDAMGWDAAFSGKWATGWSEIQQQYYSYLGMRRTGRRWLVALTTKFFDVSWDLWMDRNGVNARLKEQRDRLHLESRVSAEFELGYQFLHLRSRKLFTTKTLEERLILSDQALESWLLRVASARRWADLEPGQVQRELVELAQRDQRQHRRATMRRNQEQMQQTMSRWLQGDHQD